MPIASLDDWLMFLHVLAAMVWVGGLVALNAFAVLALRAGDRDAVARFAGSFRTIGPFVLMPAAIAVLVFGVWMVLVEEAWTFEQTWIWLAVLLLVAAVLVGAIFLSRAALAAQRALDAGDLTRATTQLRRWSWGIRLIILLLVVATWDMVFKPGA
ncbi:MAG TPA: DUF2269 family protein [Actinomycetes bacterium]